MEYLISLCVGEVSHNKKHIATESERHGGGVTWKPCLGSYIGGICQDVMSYFNFFQGFESYKDAQTLSSCYACIWGAPRRVGGGDMGGGGDLGTATRPLMHFTN
jgi:hypothetical protein